MVVGRWKREERRKKKEERRPKSGDRRPKTGSRAYDLLKSAMNYQL